ncbi:uncharacterized protein LOC112043521 [Bicyclus anynana]|uniref:Uncharacterized protein LOC112043521 n=1 Tax=Bicyclus anynana TaxID=110368 RepID=A0A6J1MPC1_BICAN|nr:uncharacterized protein LOC112043521 [Bicyclus anynana]
MEAGSSPKRLTTTRRVKYRESAWRVHEFEVWSGELLCRAAVLRMDGSALVWLGAQDAQLGDMALGMPHENGALATALLGSADDAVRLARRLAAARARPAHVCCSLALNRFTAPLVERALAAELKAHPDCF